ncbi:MAG TPA: hypothetical protein VEG08_08285 [Terriglobales bacterium]|nr:hypothetical protein [Terriglobales bacterium]
MKEAIFGPAGMNLDGNLEAHLAVLLYLGTALLLAMGASAGLCFVIRRRWRWAGRTAVAMLAVMVAYLAVLVGFSLASRETVLASGENKYLCAMDCHAAYAVVEVKQEKTVGGPAHPLSARGTYYVVTLRTWFDGSTTAPWRPKTAPLTPDARLVEVVDEQGRRFPESREAEQALAESGVGSTPLAQPLLPDTSYTTVLVFDLPAETRAPRLLVSQAAPALLIGNESSWLHAKTWFRLGG